MPIPNQIASAHSLPDDADGIVLNVLPRGKDEIERVIVLRTIRSN